MKSCDWIGCSPEHDSRRVCIGGPRWVAGCFGRRRCIMLTRTRSFVRLWGSVPTLLLTAAAWSLAAETAPSPVPNPRPFLEELERKMTSVRSVFLEFTQERQLKLFTEPLRTEGVMLIEKPDRVRWETTKPFGSILL